MKKIVAIGGGFIGEINDLGVKQSYETGLFDPISAARNNGSQYSLCTAMI